jgi:hypothetical protein
MNIPEGLTAVEYHQQLPGGYLVRYKLEFAPPKVSWRWFLEVKTQGTWYPVCNGSCESLEGAVDVVGRVTRGLGG